MAVTGFRGRGRRAPASWHWRLQAEGGVVAVRDQREASPTRCSVRPTQVAKGLSKAHAQGVVHRDLKPANLFLADDGSGFVVKLLDFGVAKVQKAQLSSNDLLTTPGQQLGTLHYMSPEQIQGEPVDERTDVWALGVLSCECLTGEAPFEGKTIAEIIAAVCTGSPERLSAITSLPPAFDEWQSSALSRSRRQRERSVAALAERFQVLSAGMQGRCTMNPTYTKVSTNVLTAFASTTRSSWPGKRMPSSIPVAIDGGRDLDHIGLVSRISRTSAVLWTRQRCVVGQAITLTLHFERDQGYSAPGWVLEVSERSDERPELWHYEVEVGFEQALEGLDAELAAFAARV